MNTDVAISYKAKLIEIDNKIKEIEKIGFDMSRIREELNDIKVENNNDIKKSKKNSFEGSGTGGERDLVRIVLSAKARHLFPFLIFSPYAIITLVKRL